MQQRGATRPLFSGIQSSLERPGIRAVAGSVALSVSESNLPMLVIGSSTLGTRVRQAAISLMAGKWSEGSRYGQAEKDSGEGEGICFREERLRRLSDPWRGSRDRY